MSMMVTNIDKDPGFGEDAGENNREQQGCGDTQLPTTVVEAPSCMPQRSTSKRLQVENTGLSCSLKGKGNYITVNQHSIGA